MQDFEYTDKDRKIEELGMLNYLYKERIKELQELRMPHELDMRLERIEKVIYDLILLITNKKQSQTKKSKVNAVSKKLRQKILERDNWTCKNCGKSQEGFKEIKLHIDHIIPREKGGKVIESNLQVLCSSCNLMKKNYIFNEMAKEIAPCSNSPSASAEVEDLIAGKEQSADCPNLSADKISLPADIK